MNAVRRNDIHITSDNVFYEIRKQIRKVEKYAYQHSQELMKTFGITGPQMGVLRVISSNSTISLSEIANRMGLHITTAEGIINRMQYRKFVKKQKSAKDKRVVEVSITEKGKKILKEAPVGAMGQFYRNLQKISDEEARQIYKTLSRIVELYGAADKEM
jgi:MarR family transcriptional regulator, organic hydroperoxide resistance regulator